MTEERMKQEFGGYDWLNHLPFPHDEDITYSSHKKFVTSKIEEVCKSGPNLSAIQSVSGTYYYYLEEAMDENGLEKAANIFAGFLYMVQRNQITPSLAREAWQDATSILSGKYDDLMTEEDRTGFYEDIKTVMTFLDAHPEVMEGKSVVSI